MLLSLRLVLTCICAIVFNQYFVACQAPSIGSLPPGSMSILNSFPGLNPLSLFGTGSTGPMFDSVGSNSVRQGSTSSGYGQQTARSSTGYAQGGGLANAGAGYGQQQASGGGYGTSENAVNVPMNDVIALLALLATLQAPSSTPPPLKKIPGCEDKQSMCETWTVLGECQSNAPYMLQNCIQSCGICHALYYLAKPCGGGCKLPIGPILVGSSQNLPETGFGYGAQTTSGYGTPPSGLSGFSAPGYGQPSNAGYAPNLQTSGYAAQSQSGGGYVAAKRSKRVKRQNADAECVRETSGGCFCRVFNTVPVGGGVENSRVSDVEACIEKCKSGTFNVNGQQKKCVASSFDTKVASPESNCVLFADPLSTDPSRRRVIDGVTTWTESDADQCQSCSDKNQEDRCCFWAATGQCTINPDYMLINCRESCHVAGIQVPEDACGSGASTFISSG